MNVPSRPMPNPFSASCPSRGLLEVIAGKWPLLVISALASGAMRNSDLHRKIEGVSPKMLTQTLRSLEAHGLVERRDYAEVPPRVDYRLTPLGESLRHSLAGIDEWVLKNFWTVSDTCEACGTKVGRF